VLSREQEVQRLRRGGSCSGDYWCAVSEQVQRGYFSRGAGAEEVLEKCRGAEVQRCRGAEVERWRGGVVERWRGGGAEVQRCRGAEVQRCRGAEVQRWCRCRGAQVLRGCRRAEVQKCHWRWHLDFCVVHRYCSICKLVHTQFYVRSSEKKWTIFAKMHLI
jgi:hypothetical protein